MNDYILPYLQSYCCSSMDILQDCSTVFIWSLSQLQMLVQSQEHFALYFLHFLKCYFSYPLFFYLRLQCLMLSCHELFVMSHLFHSWPWASGLLFHSSYVLLIGIKSSIYCCSQDNLEIQFCLGIFQLLLNIALMHFFTFMNIYAIVQISLVNS